MILKTYGKVVSIKKFNGRDIRDWRELSSPIRGIGLMRRMKMEKVVALDIFTTDNGKSFGAQALIVVIFFNCLHKRCSIFNPIYDSHFQHWWKCACIYIYIYTIYKRIPLFQLDFHVVQKYSHYWMVTSFKNKFINIK